MALSMLTVNDLLRSSEVNGLNATLLNNGGDAGSGGNGSPSSVGSEDEATLLDDGGNNLLGEAGAESPGGSTGSRGHCCVWECVGLSFGGELRMGVEKANLKCLRA
jgi:hypothetical protein